MGRPDAITRVLIGGRQHLAQHLVSSTGQPLAVVLLLLHIPHCSSLGSQLAGWGLLGPGKASRVARL